MTRTPCPAASWRRGGRQASGACVHSVHGQRRRPRARLRRPVRGAAEGVPRPRARHQLHPGRPRREGRRGKRHRASHSTAGGTSSPRPRSPGPRRPRARGCPGLSVAGPGTAGPEAGTVTRRGPGAGTAGRPPTPRPAPAGARPGAVHGLARRRAAPLGRARAPARPAAAPRRRPAQPLPPLQQQGGLRRRRAAEAGLGRRHPPAAPSGDPRSERACPPVAARRRGGVAFPWCSRVSEALAWSAASPLEEGVCARAREPRPRRLRPEVPAAPPTRVSGPQL